MKWLAALLVGCLGVGVGTVAWWVLTGGGIAAVEQGHEQARAVLQSGLQALAGRPDDVESGAERSAHAPATAEAPIPDPPAVSPGVLAVVVPTREVLLAPARFSKVIDVEVTAGQRVEAGDVLARMDVSIAEGELAAARAAARAARAQTERRRIEARRAEAAADRAHRVTEFLPADELDALSADVDMAAADRRAASATAQQRHARTTEILARIEDATMTAPFDGTIAQRYAEAGTTLAAGEPVVHLISDARMIRFAIPEGRIEEVALGQRVEVDFPAHGVTALAEVTTISPEVDATARIVIAEASLALLAEDAGLVRVGTLGRVYLGPRRDRGLTFE